MTINFNSNGSANFDLSDSSGSEGINNVVNKRLNKVRCLPLYNFLKKQREDYKALDKSYGEKYRVVEGIKKSKSTLGEKKYLEQLKEAINQKKTTGEDLVKAIEPFLTNTDSEHREEYRHRGLLGDSDIDQFKVYRKQEKGDKDALVKFNQEDDKEINAITARINELNTEIWNSFLSSHNQFAENLRVLYDNESTKEQKDEAIQNLDTAVATVIRNLNTVVSENIPAEFEPKKILFDIEAANINANYTSAMHHSSNYQWSKAKDLLPKLPEKIAEDCKIAISATQYELGMSILTLAKAALQMLPASLPYRIAESALQIGTNPLVARYCYPHFTSFPEELRSELKKKDPLVFFQVISVVDTMNRLLISPHLQQDESERSQTYFNYITIPLHVAAEGVSLASSVQRLLAAQNPVDFASSLLSCGLDLNSFLCTVYSYRKEPCPLMQTISDIGKITLPFRAANSALTPTLRNNISQCVGSTRAAQCARETLPSCLAQEPSYSVLRAEGTAIGACYLLNQFPQIYAVHLIEFAEKKRSQGDTEGAIEYLNEPRRFCDNEFVSLYSKCMTALDSIFSNSSKNENEILGFIRQINAVLIRFKTTIHSSEIPQILQLAKLMGYFKAEKFDKIDLLLKKEKQPSLRNLLCTLILEKRKPQKIAQLREAFLSYLTDKQKTLIQDYANCILHIENNDFTIDSKIGMLSKFLTENQSALYQFSDLQEKLLSYYLDKSPPDLENINQILSGKDAVIHAKFTEMLFGKIKSQANPTDLCSLAHTNLTNLQHRDEISIFADYLEKRKNKSSEALGTIDLLLESLRAKEEATSLCNYIKNEKLAYCIAGYKLKEANELLQESQSAEGNRILVSHFLDEAYKLSPPNKNRFLQKVYEQLTHLHDRNILNLYGDYLDLRKQPASLALVLQAEEILKQIELYSVSPQRLLELKKARAFASLEINDFQRAKEALFDPEIYRAVSLYTLHRAETYRHQQGDQVAGIFLKNLINNLQLKDTLFDKYILFLSLSRTCHSGNVKEMTEVINSIDDLLSLLKSEPAISPTLEASKLYLQMQIGRVLFADRKYSEAYKFFRNLKKTLDPKDPLVPEIKGYLESLKLFIK